jgi:phage-related protein
MTDLREVIFRGDSLVALRKFPLSARKRAGRQLELVQMGYEPSDWKLLTTVGAGV